MIRISTIRDILHFMIDNIGFTIRWFIELAIIAVTIFLTIRGAKKKKQTFSAIALFLCCVMAFLNISSSRDFFIYLIYCRYNIISLFIQFFYFALELISIAGIIINIIFLVKNRTVCCTKDLNVVSCPQCGTLLPTGKKFCIKCGAELNPTTENESI